MGKKLKKKDLLITTTGRGSISKRLFASRLMQAILDVTVDAGVSLAETKEVLRQMPDMLDYNVFPKESDMRFIVNGREKHIKDIWDK